MSLVTRLLLTLIKSRCQFSENPTLVNFRWESIPDKEETEIAFQVTNYLFKYEPLYVARAETPIFDERFIGFGMTRNTQVRRISIIVTLGLPLH